jgi:hypothetical protein
MAVSVERVENKPNTQTLTAWILRKLSYLPASFATITERNIQNMTRQQANVAREF